MFGWNKDRGNADLYLAQYEKGGDAFLMSKKPVWVEFEWFALREHKELVQCVVRRLGGIVSTQVILNTLFEAIRQANIVANRKKAEDKELELFDRLVSGNF